VLYEPYFATDEIGSIFSDRATLQFLLDFEAALARGEAGAGLIPTEAAIAIATACRAELYDPASIAKAAAKGGSAAIPLVKALTAQVEGEAKRYVHWGATSQDALDTALVLQQRQALTIVERDLVRLARALAALASRHRATVMAGRTWLQQALPITFGLKAAGWLSFAARQRRRLVELRPRLLVIELGGAAGTLASLGDSGPAAIAAVARELGLAAPTLPWHSMRDRSAEAAAFLALLAGGLGKIARDVSLLMQTEIGEVAEKSESGAGGSSTMPHKRNPAVSSAILAAAHSVPGLAATVFSAQVHEQERDGGALHAEGRALQEIYRLAGGALANSVRLVEGLEIDAKRMRANLDATRGLLMSEAVMMALGPALGRLVAHDRVEAACRKALADGNTLVDALAADKEIARHLPRAELERLTEPAHYLGAAQSFIDRALEEYASVFPVSPS
jgi:3-carboxy-cis,cis-muconate cycloisomerase